MTISAETNRSVLLRHGPLGAQIAALAADTTPLGAIEQWPSSLLATLRLILPAQAQIVLFWGPEFVALYNEAYAPTIGTKHPGALGRPAAEGWRELWDDLGPLLQGVRSSGETFQARDRPFYLERDGARGEQVFFDISYSPVTDEAGGVDGVLCIVNETTGRVRAQREAQADRDRLWTLARDPFLISDKNGVWLNASPAWTDILGWRPDELTGRTSEWMEHPDDRTRTHDEIGALAAGRPTDRYENRFRDTEGRYHWFSWTAVPEGDLVYCVARDVTRERDAADALRAAEDQLRQAQKMETVGQLTGGVAHDFNNLLQIVTGNLDILLRHLPPDQPRLERAAGNALAGAHKAAVLTQRLLAFSRRQPLAPERLSPAQLIHGMEDLLHRTLGEVIDVRIVTDEAPVLVEVDANQLENALLNLAVNARDAMGDGGRLTIETATQRLTEKQAAREPDAAAGDYVVISVTDTGTGMDAATIERAFDPFFTTKEVGRGTGLGLSMVYGFIKQSGGHVRIYSEPGEGTTIAIYLPSADGLETLRHDGAPDGAIPRARAGETVLICEDNEDVRAFSGDVLRELGYRVMEAGDAHEALDLLAEHGEAIHVLFTDVVLPGGITGEELSHEAASRYPRLKVLFATGYARNAMLHSGRLDPGVVLLTKPFSYDDLARRLRDLLDRHAAAG